MMSPRDFVAGYETARDRARIAFNWNGEHAEQFRDANYDYRRLVLKVVLTNLASAPIDLVRDLYDAETAWAKEAWCVNSEAVSALARELLTRGGPDYAEDFLTGKVGRGMDASCAAYFDCPRELAERLLARVEHNLALGAEGHRNQLLEAGRDIFRSWIETSVARAGQ
jgi:hypothetical protein